MYDTYDKKLRACNDLVVLRKVEKKHVIRQIGGIFVPADYGHLFMLTCGIVESVGPKAKCEGLEVGMKVLYDTYSVFYKTDPIVVTRVENIIGILPDDFDPNKDKLVED